MDHNLEKLLMPILLDDDSSDKPIEENNDTKHEIIKCLKIFMVLFLLISFYVAEAATEHFKPRFGHHTSLIVIFGATFSLILNFTVKDTKDWTQNPETYFLFFVPFLIFNAGFNMRRKQFFANIGNITLLGNGVG